jgi:hypothetical protein
MDLPGTVAFDHPTAAALAAFISTRLGASEPHHVEQLQAAARLQPVDGRHQR